MPQPGPFQLASTFLRLRSDVSIEPLPVDSSFWPRLMSGQLGNFHHEYLVTTHAYDADWPNWEMHPNGDEVVCLLSGSVLFILDLAEGPRSLPLTESGSYVVVPRGTWHTAKSTGPCRLLFITAGEGTQHRPLAASVTGHV
jgi:mannose-6-phosphate isomerase-like protein (cupin superfamily)